MEVTKTIPFNWERYKENKDHYKENKGGTSGEEE